MRMPRCFWWRANWKNEKKTKDYSVISDGGPFDECCKIATKLTIIASRDKGYHHIKPERRLAPQGANEKWKEMYGNDLKRGKTGINKSRLVLSLHLIGWEGGAAFLY